MVELLNPSQTANSDTAGRGLVQPQGRTGLQRRVTRRTVTITIVSTLLLGLLAAAAVGLRPAGNTGPVQGAALSAPAAGGVVASGAGLLPIQTESGLREYLPGQAAGGSERHASALGGLLEYLPGERPALATAAHGGAGPLEYLPGEAPAGADGTVVPPVGLQP